MLVSFTVLLLCNVVLAYEGESLQYYELDKAEEYFEWFVKTHEKSYNGMLEEKSRFEIFKENLKKINEKNAAEQTPVFGINIFSDLSVEEFSVQYTGLLNLNESLGNDICQRQAMDMPYGNAPASFDWRSQGIVTPVKSQGSCGSCWAFATAGNVESLYARKYRRTINLSPQQLVDCDSSSNGCEGGFPTTALSYIISTGGLQSEESYPYENTQRQCRHNPSNAVAKLRSCFNSFGSEDQMKEILYQTGPLVVVVDGEAVQYYRGGIVLISQCPCRTYNHAVLLVGYGEEGGVPYWIIKNSWGAQWGEGGYYRIQRGANTCCVAKMGVASGVIA